MGFRSGLKSFKQTSSAAGITTAASGFLDAYLQTRSGLKKERQQEQQFQMQQQLAQLKMQQIQKEMAPLNLQIGKVGVTLEALDAGFPNADKTLNKELDRLIEMANSPRDLARIQQGVNQFRNKQGGRQLQQPIRQPQAQLPQRALTPEQGSRLRPGQQIAPQLQPQPSAKQPPTGPRVERDIVEGVQGGAQAFPQQPVANVQGPMGRNIQLNQESFQLLQKILGSRSIENRQAAAGRLRQSIAQQAAKDRSAEALRSRKARAEQSKLNREERARQKAKDRALRREMKTKFGKAARVPKLVEIGVTKALGRRQKAIDRLNRTQLIPMLPKERARVEIEIQKSNKELIRWATKYPQLRPALPPELFQGATLPSAPGANLLPWDQRQNAKPGQQLRRPGDGQLFEALDKFDNQGRRMFKKAQ